MRRAIAFVIGLSLATAVFWSFAFPVIVAKPLIAHMPFRGVLFVPVWQALDREWAYGWLAAELVLCCLLGLAAACVVPDPQKR